MRVSSPKRELRHRQLLDAALRVFARDGFDGASVAAIADEAGVAKGSVYLYFDSKEALAGDLVRYVFSSEEGNDPPSQIGRPLDQIVEFCVQQEARILSLGEFSSIVLHMWSHVGKSENNQIARGIRQIASESLFLIETLVERAKELGELPRTVDPAVAARVALAITYGLIQQRVTFEGNVAGPTASCADALRAYLRGLGAPG